AGVGVFAVGALERRVEQPHAHHCRERDHDHQYDCDDLRRQLARVGQGGRVYTPAVKISREEAKRIAELAHLEFDDAGLQRMADEMTKILSYIDQLKEVDGAPALAGGGPAEAGAPLRDDVARPGIPREEVERNAPA